MQADIYEFFESLDIKWSNINSLNYACGWFQIRMNPKYLMYYVQHSSCVPIHGE